jgi:hypothetical protein
MIVTSWMSHEKLQDIFPEYNVIQDNISIIPDILKKTVYIQTEPDFVYNSREHLINNYNLYYKIFTWDEYILSKCPNAILYMASSRWLHCYDKNIKKTFKISNLCGTKNFSGTVSYNLRMELYKRQSEFKNFPVTFFRSSQQIPHLEDYGNNPFIMDSKLPLFEGYQFSIIIENCKTFNMFTEKLLDCLKQKVIPIYCGCTNIDEYFDTSGWILFDTVDDLLNKLSIIDDSYYDKYLETTDNNYIKSDYYSCIYENLGRASQNM